MGECGSLNHIKMLLRCQRKGGLNLDGDEVGPEYLQVL